MLHYLTLFLDDSVLLSQHLWWSSLGLWPWTSSRIPLQFIPVCVLFSWMLLGVYDMICLLLSHTPDLPSPSSFSSYYSGMSSSPKEWGSSHTQVIFLLLLLCCCLQDLPHSPMFPQLPHYSKKCLHRIWSLCLLEFIIVNMILPTLSFAWGFPGNQVIYAGTTTMATEHTRLKNSSSEGDA